MGLMGALAEGYWKAVPRIEARHQQEIENQRANEKQEAWRQQQARQQAIYEDALRERASNRYAAMHPDTVRGIVSGKISEIPEELGNVSFDALYKLGIKPEQDLMLAFTKNKNKDKTAFKKFQGEDGNWYWGVLKDDGTMTPSQMRAPAPTGTPSAIVNMPGVNKYLQKEGEKASDWRTEVMKQADASVSMLDMLDRMNQMTEEGFQPGILTPAKSFIASGMQSLGLDPKAIGLDTAEKYQAYRALVQEYTFNLLKEQKGVQTEGDAKRAQEAFANAQNVAEANLLITEYKKRIAQRSLEYEKFVNEKLNPDGSNFREVQREWHQYLMDNPLFPEKKEEPQSSAPRANISDKDLESIFNKYNK